MTTLVKALYALRVRMGHLALEPAVGRQTIEVIPVGESHRPTAHHRAVACRIGLLRLHGIHRLLPRRSGGNARQDRPGVDPHIIRSGLEPGYEALSQVRGVQGAMGQEAVGQGHRHLGVVGEGAGRQRARSHVAHQAVGRATGAELEGHAEGVSCGSAHGAALYAILDLGVHDWVLRGLARCQKRRRTACRTSQVRATRRYRLQGTEQV
jgi:hypothetical protein